MKIFYFILVILFTFFVVSFSLDNVEMVRIKYLTFVDTQIRLYMLIFAAMLVGVVITWFMGAMERFRLNRTISKQNKTIRDLRKELRANEPPPIIENNKKQP